MEKKKFGLIGYPVKHSMSAVMHAAAFRKLNLDCTYELFEVKPEELESFMKNIKGFTGLNVTIPHKVSVMKYLDEVEKVAGMIGAVNTIKFNKNRVGYNTDGVGCMKALESGGVRISGSRFFVLGAGGAAKSITYHLALLGAGVTIADSAKDKAIELAASLTEKIGANVNVIDADEKSIGAALKENDVFINATPVGMHHKVDETPVERKLLRPGLTVMDIVYNPLRTRLLREAAEVGCKTIDGVDMLVNQGAESLRIWLGIEPPVDGMRKAVQRKLSG